MVIGLTALNTFVYGISFDYGLNQTIVLTFLTTGAISGIIVAYSLIQKNRAKRKLRIKS